MTPSKASKKTIINKLIGIAFIVLAGAMLLNGIAVCVLVNISMGTWLTFALGAFFLAVGIFWKKIISVPKAVLITLLSLLLVGIIFFSFLYIFGSFDTTDHKEDALIVLGCGVKGDEPGANLAERLDKALEYHEKNPDAIIVVSGGKGDDENVSEAFAMEQYLIKHGVPKDLIIKEDQATSTEENFIFSKEILDKYFEGSYTTAFITNDFHIYRSLNFAKLTGFENVTHEHSDTTWYTVVPNGLRECITVLKLWVLDQNRLR